MKWEKGLQIGVHVLFFLCLILVLFGGYFVEFFLQHKPCSLCYLQRLGMILAALCLLINLKGGGNSKSLGVCLLAALFGSIVALRHNSLKFCCTDAIKPVIWGKSLPVWAFWVFGFCMIGIAVLLLFKENIESSQKSSALFKAAFILLSIVLILGVLSALVTRGLGF